MSIFAALCVDITPMSENKGKQMKNIKVEPRLEKRLGEFARKLQVSYGYSSEIAKAAAIRHARCNWDVVVDNGVLRELKPTAADGRVAG